MSSLFSTRRYELLAEAGHTTEKDCNTCRGRKKQCINSVCFGIGIYLAALVSFLLLSVLLEADYSPRKIKHLRETVYWSPILDDIEIPQKAVTINGTVRAPPKPSIARQEPSKANDAEWAAYGNSPRFALTRDDIIKLGKDPETSARWDRDYWGFDEDLYVGTLNLAHQIHCLDFIRRKAYSDYPGYKPHIHKAPHIVADPDINATLIQWMHLGHCLDQMLQTLLCNADTSISTYTYVAGEEEAWPDWNMKAQCRDSEAVFKWARKRDMKGWKHAPRPNNSFVWPHPLRGEPDFELGIPLGHHHQQEGDPNYVPT